MSLVLSASVKADVRLEQAVKQFEAILTPQQALRFRGQRNAANASPPTIHDVRALLLEVDNIVRSKTSTRRAFSPRLSSVVEAVQKFASIGDVLIGGSQNLIACGVWSIVRLALLSVATSLSALERLSNFFMAVGRVAPRYEDLAFLYPQSERLQAYLCEYHIVVVTVCQELVFYTQKSGISLFMSSLSSSTWESYQKSLDAWSKCIKDEVDSLMIQTVEHESSRNSAFRTFVSGELRKDSLMKQWKARREALDACSTYDYEASFRQQRKVGTADFFKKLHAYSHWKDIKGSSSFIIEGKLGAGKTVMMANIVDDLRIEAAKTGANIAYFFCRYDLLESLKERVVLGSLLREILRSTPGSIPWDSIAQFLSTSSSAELLPETLARFLPSQTATYLVIDGIDHFARVDVERLLRKLKALQELRPVKVCVSYRANSFGTSRKLDLHNKILLAMPEDSTDIRDYITIELEKRLQTGDLAINDPSLIEDIYKTLVTGAKGMFLWVALQIECLCIRNSDKDIRSSLLELPKTLPPLFARLLHEAAPDSEAKREQFRIFELAISAVRPLRLEEIREALSVEPGNMKWDMSRMPNNIRSSLARCGCLLVVDEEDLSVRLAHHSVLKYLLQEYTSLDGSFMTQKNADRSFAAILITYLNYGVFETRLSKTTHPRLPVQALQVTILQSTLESSMKQKLAMHILKSISRSDRDAGDMIGQEVERMLESKTAADQIYHLYDYARRNLLAHAWVYFDDVADSMVPLLSNLLDRDQGLVELAREPLRDSNFTTWDTKPGRRLALTYLLCAELPVSSPELPSVFDTLEKEDTSSFVFTFLEWACTDGHLDIVLLWLKKASAWHILYPQEYYGRAIHAALIKANYAIADAVAKHVAELYPNFGFVTLWVEDCKSAVPIDDAPFGAVVCSTKTLDQILLLDNDRALSFLLDRNIIESDRMDPVAWKDTFCVLSLRERCLWKSSFACVSVVLERTMMVCSRMQSLMSYTPIEAEVRTELLCHALNLGYYGIAEQFVKASSINQRISEHEKLYCLSLAVEKQCIFLVDYMLTTAEWFNDGIKRWLPVVLNGTEDSKLQKMLNSHYLYTANEKSIVKTTKLVVTFEPKIDMDA